MAKYLLTCCLFVAAACSDMATAQRPNRGKRTDQANHRAKRADVLHEGDMAPDFKLKTLDGKVTVELSELYKDRPVALIFGSYT